MTLERSGEALDILTRAYNFWKPNWIFLLYSGGNDSVVSTHIANAWARAIPHGHVKAISIDTHVSADGWRDYVTRVANKENWTHEIWDNPDPEFYYNNCREFGTPHTREMHWMIMYRNLKERAIDAVRRAHKTGQRDRCMLVSGFRRDESTERADTPEWLEDGAGLWVSPLVNWTERDVYEYRLVHAFEPNPFYETVGGSGDCECNWTRNTSVATLERYSPVLASKIRPMDAECRLKFGYGYGDTPSKGLIAERAGQMPLPGIMPLINLCAGCSARDPLEATMRRRKLEQPT